MKPEDYKKLQETLDAEQLHFAASDGNLARVEELLSKGAPLDHFDELGKTPLHYAAENEHLEVVRFLLNAGADVNACDEKQAGNTPLREIAATCSFEMAKALVDAGANPNIPGWMQITAVHQTAARKQGDGPRIHALLTSVARNFDIKKG